MPFFAIFELQKYHLDLEHGNKIRKIIHIDMDAFFASVEQLDKPELRGKPLAVSNGTQRGVVAAASYEAREFGVRSAMSNTEALRRCPQLIFTQSNFSRYREISQKIFDLFREYTDLVEPLSIDEAFLDVTENKQNEPFAMTIAEEIRQRIKSEFGLTASAGVSYNKFLAKTASDVNKPDGMFVITPKSALPFLDALPIRDFYGVGKVTAKKMNRLGVFNGKDLRQFSERDLVRHFGKVGHFYFSIANGIDGRSVRTHRERKSVGTERTFLNDITDREQVVEALQSIAKELSHRASKKEVAGYTITLKVTYSDFKKATRSKTTELPIDSVAKILNVAFVLWDKLDIREGVRLLGLSFSKLVPIVELPKYRKRDLFSEW